MILFETQENEVWDVTKEGMQMIEDGSHEWRVFNAIPPGDEGMALKELEVCIVT